MAAVYISPHNLECDSERIKHHRASYTFTLSAALWLSARAQYTDK